jgi:hypothetical protein
MNLLGDILGSRGDNYKDNLFLHAVQCSPTAIVKAVSSPETSVSIHKTTLCNIPEDSRLGISPEAHKDHFK